MSEFSYNDLLKLIPQARSRKFPEPNCDPILEHCIKLRKFHNEVDNLVLLTANLREIYKDSERERILKSLPPIPELPELANKITDNDKNILALEKVELSDDTVLKLVTKAVARVLFVLGYTDIPSHLLQKLGKIIVNYIKTLSEMTVELMDEDGSNSVDSLETVLQKQGIDGIGELYSFYTQRVVKFHDSLYLKCKRSLENLKTNLKKPDAPPKKIILESCKDEHSTDAIKKDKNNDMKKTSLESEMPAEDSFSPRKLRQKTVSFAFKTEDDDTNNHEDSNKTKNAINQGKSEMIPDNFLNLGNVLNESLEDCTKIDSNLTSESDKQDSKVTNVLCNSVNYSDDESSDWHSNDATDEEYIPNKSELGYSSYKQKNLIANTKTPNKLIIDSELVDKPFNFNNNVVSDGAITSGSYSKIEGLFTKNIRFSKYTDSNSDSSNKPNDITSRKLSNKLACHSNDKPNHSRRTRKKSTSTDYLESPQDSPNSNKRSRRKSNNMENLESQNDSPINKRRKRPRFVKRRKISESDSGSENMSSKTKNKMKKAKLPSSSADCDIKNGICASSEENSLSNMNSVESL